MSCHHPEATAIPTGEPGTQLWVCTVCGAALALLNEADVRRLKERSGEPSAGSGMAGHGTAWRG